MLEKRAKVNKYTEAFESYYQVVFNAVYTKVNRREDAEDICQEIFLILYDKLDEVENIRKWLFGTIKNVVLKYYRDKKPADKSIDDIFDDVGLTFVNGFRDTRLIINDAIEEEIRDDDERMLVDLIAFSNYSYTHVAKVMGLTKKQVEYRYGQIAKRILDNLMNRGIKNIEDIL